MSRAGLPVAAALGLVLGWLAGAVAISIPVGKWCSPLCQLRGIRSAGMEQVLGATIGLAGLTLAYHERESLAMWAATACLILILDTVLLIDLRHHAVYPLTTLLGIITALLLNPLAGTMGLRAAILGALTGGATFLVLFGLGQLIFRVEALGLGDVLLAVMIGAMVGFPLILRALFLGALLGALASGALLLSRQMSLHDYIPFGTGMCVAAIIVLIWR